MHHFSAQTTGQTIHACKHVLQEAITARYCADGGQRSKKAVSGDGEFLTVSGNVSHLHKWQTTREQH